jgi:hypothetical protein
MLDIGRGGREEAAAAAAAAPRHVAVVITGADQKVKTCRCAAGGLVDVSGIF